MAKFGQEEEERASFGKQPFPENMWTALDKAVNDFGRDRIPPTLAAQIGGRDKTVFDGGVDEETFIYQWMNTNEYLGVVKGVEGPNNYSRTPWPSHWLSNAQYGLATGNTIPGGVLGVGESKRKVSWEFPCDWNYDLPGPFALVTFPGIFTQFAFDTMNFWQTQHMYINTFAVRESFHLARAAGVVKNAFSLLSDSAIAPAEPWLRRLECAPGGKCAPELSPGFAPRGLLQLSTGLLPATTQIGLGFGFKPQRANVAWFFIMDAKYCPNFGFSGKTIPPNIKYLHQEVEYFKVIPFFSYSQQFGNAGPNGPRTETYEELFGGLRGSYYFPTEFEPWPQYINARIIDWTS